MPVALIAAVAKNRCIGKDGKLPWNIPEDLKFFKEKTLGKIVVMGRKTWESIPEKFRPLPDRANVVITRQSDFPVPSGVETFSSIVDALEAHEYEDVMVAGGAQIYADALPLADTLYLTHVEEIVEGDVFFPETDPKEWEEIERIPGPNLAWVTYRRR